MKTSKARTRTAAMVVMFGILAYALIATGGGLEPIAPPGPTMYTLEEIYNLIGSQVQKPNAFDCFMEVEGVAGESTDPTYADWIDLLAYSHGVSQPPSTGPSPSPGKSEHKDFTVVKLLDRASPELSFMCCQGTHIPKVTVELRSATGSKGKYMTYVLDDVTVTAVDQFTAGATQAGRPLEEVSFNYAKIAWQYTYVHPGTGQQMTIQHNWDVALNQGH